MALAGLPTTTPLTPLQPGDRVVVLSPSSWPEAREHVDELLGHLSSWGLRPELSAHATDRRGYTAGTVADRLADINTALRDPGVRALVASRGGCGASRLAKGVDLQALRRDPKPLVGYSDITALHLLWVQAGVPVIHGAVHGEHRDLVRAQLQTSLPTSVTSAPDMITAALTTSGTARGLLVGGSLELLARSVGVVQTSWDGCILMIEANRAAGLGMVDRALTQLRLSGALDGITGVAVGSFDQFTGYSDRGWTVLDTLHDLLDDLAVPVLGGLPLGHLDDPVPVPLGVVADLDADAGDLTAAPLVQQVAVTEPQRTGGLRDAAHLRHP